MISKTMYIVFGILVLLFLVLVFKLYYLDKEVEYKRTIHAVVTEIYGVRGRPTQRVAKLSDNTSIAIPDAFISKIQVGDSVIKQANSNSYKMKSKNTSSIIITTK